MGPIRVSDSLVPLSSFKSQAPMWLEKLSKVESLIITQNGRAAGVLLSPAKYDHLMEEHNFLKSIKTGLLDADNGKVMDTQKMKQRLARHREEKTG
ncbi:MAG: type II toxin-antitoxin system Phd/YefM family antitoxin [Candidatus Electryonea clarkiae]|nr:type II toxin-antitoxin system Phd/YefM family antitoxin [Candidatus Electryonea clarkiae]MDP8285599.1 type II toxin-antitoxin system Phd/YefM family antitoxin [Candidatus Electryonea clarkiae]